jgi:hypothetical protein
MNVYELLSLVKEMRFFTGDGGGTKMYVLFTRVAHF